MGERLRRKTKDKEVPKQGGGDVSGKGKLMDEASKILDDLIRADMEDVGDFEKATVESGENDPLYKVTSTLAAQSKDLIKWRDSIKTEISKFSRKKDALSQEQIRLDEIKLEIIRRQLAKVSNKIEDINEGRTKDFKTQNRPRLINENIANELIRPFVEQILRIVEKKIKPILDKAIKSRFRDRDFSGLTQGEVASLGAYVAIVIADKLKPELREIMLPNTYDEFEKTGVSLAEMIRPGVDIFMMPAYESLRHKYSAAIAKEREKKLLEVKEAAKSEGVEIGELGSEEVDKLWEKIQRDKIRVAKDADMAVKLTGADTLDVDARDMVRSVWNRIRPSLNEAKDYFLNLLQLGPTREEKRYKDDMLMVTKLEAIIGWRDAGDFLSNYVMGKIYLTIDDELPAMLKLMDKNNLWELNEREYAKLYVEMDDMVRRRVFPMVMDPAKKKNLDLIEGRCLVTELVTAEVYNYLNKLRRSLGSPMKTKHDPYLNGRM